MERDEISVPAGAVLRHLQEIDDALEPGPARHVAGDVVQVDRHDRIHHHMTWRQAIATADADARRLPDADCRVDLARLDPLPQPLQEHHGDKDAMIVAPVHAWLILQASGFRAEERKMDEWNLPWEGGCRCGASRVRIAKPPLLTGICHCSGCQTMTAS